MTKQITFEEAKQKVAVKYNYLSFEDLETFEGWTKTKHYFHEAAALWQQSNIERIKELEDGLKFIVELGQEPTDSNSLLAAQRAKELLTPKSDKPYNDSGAWDLM